MDESNGFGTGYLRGMEQGYKDGVSAERERFMKVLESKLSELKKDTLAHEYNSDMMFGYESGLRFALEALDKEDKA